MMRIVAGGAGLVSHLAQGRIPKTSSTAVDASFPIAECWSMATAAEGRAIGNLQFPSIPSLEAHQIRFIMAVEAIVIAAVRAMTEDDVLVFAGNNNLPVYVVMNNRGFAFLMANVAIVI